MLVILERKEFKEFLVQLGLRDLQDHRVTKEKLVLLAILEQQEQQGLRDRMLRI